MTKASAPRHLLRRRWFLGLLGLASLAGLCHFLWKSYGEVGEQVLVRSNSPAAAGCLLAAADEPLFRFGDHYLDGRLDWLRERFALDRRRASLLDGGAEPSAAAKVHRQPFSSGPWLERLDARLAQHRKETEEQTVEAEVAFEVSGIAPRQLLLFTAFSGFQTAIDWEGAMETEFFLTPEEEPPAGLDDVPELEPAQFLSWERSRSSRLLARPTVVYYLNEVREADGGFCLLYEAWRCTGGKGHAVVRLASGQYFFSPAAAGTRLHLHSFYSGQALPPFTEKLVAGMTAAFYNSLARTVTARAPGWQAPERVRRWCRRQGWEE